MSGLNSVAFTTVLSMRPNTLHESPKELCDETLNALFKFLRGQLEKLNLLQVEFRITQIFGEHDHPKGFFSGKSPISDKVGTGGECAHWVSGQ